MCKSKQCNCAKSIEQIELYLQIIQDYCAENNLDNLDAISAICAVFIQEELNGIKESIGE